MDNPIGQWLRDTRLRQVMPGTRKPWSQDYLLERMQEEVKWAPHRPNYSKYENGKATPEPDTLDKFVAFWTARGEPGPDLSPKAAPEPPVDPVAAAIDRQTVVLSDLVAELLRWRTEDRARLDQVEAMLDQVVAGTLGAPDTRVEREPPVPDGAAH